MGGSSSQLARNPNKLADRAKWYDNSLDPIFRKNGVLDSLLLADHNPPPMNPGRGAITPLHQTTTPSDCSVNFNRKSNSTDPNANQNRERILLIAKYRFIPKFDNELHIEEGDQLYLLNTELDDWWYVETTCHTKGFVPSTHVKIAEIREPWFAGNIPRIVAEQRIMQPGLPKGTFLIRENPKLHLFVLTVRHSDSTHRNYIIHKAEHESRVSTQIDHTLLTFDSLHQLVDTFTDTLTTPAPPIPPSHAPHIAIDPWQIDRNLLRIGEEIGSGQYGRVMRATLNNVEVAVKMMRRGVLDEEHIRSFHQEAKFLSTLNHPNLIRLIAVCMREHPYYIVTEYMINGSLLDYLQKGVRVNRMSMDSARNIAAQIASGMSYLAANNAIHRDLAARNVLVGQMAANHIPQVKVGDFGLARQLQLNDTNYSMTSNNMMPAKWLAPEVFTNHIFNTKTDVWAFGILLWEIGSMGDTPYKEWSIGYTLEQINNGYRLPCPSYCPQYAYNNAILPCWNKDSEKRPTFDQLFKYFDSDITI